MKKLFSNAPIRLIVLIVSVILVMSGCNSPSGGEGFAIYLTREDVPPQKMPMLSHVNIAEQPIIALGDITSYNFKTHQIALTPTAYDRISNLGVPVGGKSFVVCVDRRPKYWGAFWTIISSIPFEGVVILKPYPERDWTVVTLDFGYPSKEFFRGEDPRSDSEVMKSLRQAGKLHDEL